MTGLGLQACGPTGPTSAPSDSRSVGTTAGEGGVHLLSETVSATSAARRIVLKVDVPAPTLAAVTLDGRSFTKVTVPGFDLEAAPGAPEVPSLIVRVVVPADADVRAEVVPLAKERVHRLDGELSFVSRLPYHNGKLNLVAQDLTAYQTLHGAQAVEILDVSWAGPTRLATLKISPVRYDAASRELTVRGSFEVHLDLPVASQATVSDAPIKSGFSLASYLALNGETHRATADAGRVDLVIAHESHREALARFLDWKRQNGREVREHYVSGKTNAQIKQIIVAEYGAAVPPTHTLLVGNISQIPSWRGSADNTWTDFDFLTLDSGSVPDLSLGRVPAHNASELNAFIDKAIGRETTTRNNDDVLLTAGRDVSLGCPANVSRVGDKVKAGSSSINIIKQYRSNGASTNDVINAYNGSPNIVVYDGHGDQQGMQEIPLLISNMSRLTNNKHSIIFDIACLNANWRNGANARNFAETILLRPGVGAAGILASGGSGNGHTFFQTMGKLMADARQELGDGGSPLNEVGNVVLGAKINHGTQDRTFWNYYGDPASTVWDVDAL